MTVDLIVRHARLGRRERRPLIVVAPVPFLALVADRLAQTQAPPPQPIRLRIRDAPSRSANDTRIVPNALRIVREEVLRERR
mgnify:FL=1